MKTISVIEEDIISDKLERFKRSVEYCHPQVPSLSSETALAIERYSWAGHLDNVIRDKSFEELDSLTKKFEETCQCETIGQLNSKKIIEEKQ